MMGFARFFPCDSLVARALWALFRRQGHRSERRANDVFPLVHIHSPDGERLSQFARHKRCYGKKHDRGGFVFETFVWMSHLDEMALILNPSFLGLGSIW